MQEVLQRAGRARVLFLEDSRRSVGRRQGLLELRRPRSSPSSSSLIPPPLPAVSWTGQGDAPLPAALRLLVSSSRRIRRSKEISPSRASGPPSTSIDGTPSTGLSVISVAPVSRKLEAGSIFGHRAVLAKLIASSAIDAILSGYCCEVAPMTPALTFFTPGQPPSIETISTRAVVLAGRLQRFPRAGRGGLVDRVDDVDVRALLEERSPSPCGRLSSVAAGDFVRRRCADRPRRRTCWGPSRRCRSPP